MPPEEDTIVTETAPKSASASDISAKDYSALLKRYEASQDIVVKLKQEVAAREAEAKAASREYETQIGALRAEKEAAQKAEEASRQQVSLLEVERQAFEQQAKAYEKYTKAADLAANKYGAEIARMISDRTILVDNVADEDLEAYIDKLGERISGITKSAAKEASGTVLSGAVPTPSSTSAVSSESASDLHERLMKMKGAQAIRSPEYNELRRAYFEALDREKVPGGELAQPPEVGLLP
jgi:chromosome segregation ATPase